MSRLLAGLILLLGVTAASAQQEPLIISGKDRYKQVAGRYGANEGICLFEDSTFLLPDYERCGMQGRHTRGAVPAVI